MREKLMRFMQGRYGSYGPDSLNKFLLTTAMITMLLSMFTRWNLLYVIALAALIYSYFRTLSKNYSKRYAENQMFLKSTEGIRRFYNKKINEMRQRKTHHIYKCPSCKQKIRIPKGKGKISIKCPKCSTEFIKKS